MAPASPDFLAAKNKYMGFLKVAGAVVGAVVAAFFRFVVGGGGGAVAGGGLIEPEAGQEQLRLTGSGSLAPTMRSCHRRACTPHPPPSPSPDPQKIS